MIPMRTRHSWKTSKSSSWGEIRYQHSLTGFSHVALWKYRFGNQGAAQAQNLRDSGIPNEKILIANREDSYAVDAKSKGFNVEHDFGKAAAVADGKCDVVLLEAFLDINLSVLFLLIPDQVQPRVFNEQMVPQLKDTASIVIASGYNVFYKMLNFNPKQDVIMVAPRSFAVS
jgi:ketol-acid reductoisomerase